MVAILCKQTQNDMVAILYNQTQNYFINDMAILYKQTQHYIIYNKHKTRYGCYII